MVAILILSAKLATLGRLRNKGYGFLFFVYHVTEKNFYNVTQIILQIWSSDQSLVNLAFLCENLS